MLQLSAPPFYLRAYTSADAPQFVSAVQESRATVGRWMSWAAAGMNEASALDWFGACEVTRSSGAAYEYGIFDEAGRFVGGAGLNQFNVPNGFCNLGYWVMQSAQRKGVAFAAARALSRFAFQHLGQSRVEIVVASGNEPSMAMAVKLGASYECLARNRLRLHGQPVSAHVYSLVPGRVA